MREKLTTTALSNVTEDKIATFESYFLLDIYVNSASERGILDRAVEPQWVLFIHALSLSRGYFMTHDHLPTETVLEPFKVPLDFVLSGMGSLSKSQD